MRDRKKNISRVMEWRREVKRKLVELHGGKCKKCGYYKSMRALQFHHINPIEKKFGIGNANIKAFDKLVIEAQKCELLCSNCHAEIEDLLFSGPIGRTPPC